MKKLFLSIIIVISVIIAAILFSYIADDGLKQDVYDILLFIWNRFVYPIFWFINDKFSLIVSWPIAILILLYLVFKNRLVERALYPVMHRVRAVDLFGVSVELSEQINDIQRESDDLLKRIPRFQSSLASEMQKLVLDMKIDTTFCSMVLSICDHIAGIKSGFKRENCRATVHVEGFLFSGQLIQLVEYVSGDGRVYAGKSAGRTFSVRRGIIGRVWRSQLPEIKGVLETGFDINSDEATRQIAQMWGLTRPEAVHVKNTHPIWRYRSIMQMIKSLYSIWTPPMKMLFLWRRNKNSADSSIKRLGKMDSYLR